ncbi:unnamed protein product [[Actinomadura] parvosata subsp. kistnae]|nr:hypothetical protein [Nonomuraea sp. ATCC 55076]SPL98132.1 unnamed protein product [Actinomadura parvosata subsp. kistnae]
MDDEPAMPVTGRPRAQVGQPAVHHPRAAQHLPEQRQHGDYMGWSREGL